MKENFGKKELLALPQLLREAEARAPGEAEADANDEKEAQVLNDFVSGRINLAEYHRQTILGKRFNWVLMQKYLFVFLARKVFVRQSKSSFQKRVTRRSYTVISVPSLKLQLS